MYTYRAMAVLPNAHMDRATSLLRGELYRRVIADDETEVPDWSTLSVTGPVEAFGPRGDLCFEYRASVACRSLRERLAAHA